MQKKTPEVVFRGPGLIIKHYFSCVILAKLFCHPTWILLEVRVLIDFSLWDWPASESFPTSLVDVLGALTVNNCTSGHQIVIYLILFSQLYTI